VKFENRGFYGTSLNSRPPRECDPLRATTCVPRVSLAIRREGIVTDTYPGIGDAQDYESTRLRVKFENRGFYGTSLNSRPPRECDPLRATTCVPRVRLA
jgi:hypothetical protein